MGANPMPILWPNGDGLKNRPWSTPRNVGQAKASNLMMDIITILSAPLYARFLCSRAHSA